MKETNYPTIVCAIACLLMAITVQAQSSRPKVAEEETPQQWWGYWTSDMPLVGVGELAEGNNEMCIRLTGRNPKAVGAMLHGVRFYVSDKTSVTSAKVWAASRQGVGYNLLALDVPSDQLLDVEHDGRPTTVLLDEPINLVDRANPYSNIYVGFTITMPTGGAFTPCQMMATGTSTQQGDANLYAWKTVEDGCGPLAVQLLISNPDLPDVGAVPIIPKDVVVEKGQPLTLDIPIRNEGMEGLYDLSYQLTIDGEASEVADYHFPVPFEELDGAPVIPVSIPLPDVSTFHQVGLNILTINGKDCPVESEPQPVLVVERFGTKRTVMEEFTGTWCPNCPRGTVGVSKLKEIFGQRFIPIAVHNDDPMTIADYDQSAFRKSVTRALGGFPSATVDRTYNCDPYMGYTLRYEFQTDQIVAEALEKKAIADLEVEASWDDPATTNINVRARTTYYYSSDEANHALILVLTADGLTGDAGQWLQSNEFVGRTDLPEDMDPYVNGERHQKETYNHVAVAVAGVENGISGSIATPIVCQQPQEYQRQLSFPASLRQEGMQLHAVAMLVDTTTGQIVNAQETEVTMENTGISSIVTSSQSVSRFKKRGVYDLQGRQLSSDPSSLHQGIYMIHGRKVVVR